MDKQFEEKILRVVFGETDYQIIEREEQERPDFIICPKINLNDKIGVEITEYFISDAAATYLNNFAARDEFINGGKLYHKEMVDYAFPVRINISGTEIPGVIKAPQNLDKCLSRLIEKLSNKELKRCSYSTTDTVLLINDREGPLFKYFGPESFRYLFLYKEFLNAITKSGFFEIVLLGKDKKGQTIFIPIKSSILSLLGDFVADSLKVFDLSVNQYFYGVLSKILMYFNIPAVFYTVEGAIHIHYGLKSICYMDFLDSEMVHIPDELIVPINRDELPFHLDAYKRCIEFLVKNTYDPITQAVSDEWHPYKHLIEVGSDYKIPATMIFSSNIMTEKDENGQ